MADKLAALFGECGLSKTTEGVDAWAFAWVKLMINKLKNSRHLPIIYQSNISKIRFKSSVEINGI